jgi:GT2 family glycosyltransferase
MNTRLPQGAHTAMPSDVPSDAPWRRVSVRRLPNSDVLAGDDRAHDVLALIACFNRREKTLVALRQLEAQRVREALTVGAVVIDAGSTDSTVAAILTEFPWVELVRGDPSMYWSTSMEAAQRRALTWIEPPYLLWLNDDALLDEDALTKLVATAERFHNQYVIAGALRDPASGLTTYSGMRRTGQRPTQLSPVDPTDDVQPVDTFNGNLVLIPRAVYSVVGSVDGQFGHAYGDVDYGLRVKDSGFGSVLAPGYVGSCARNEASGTWRDPRLPRRTQLQMLLGPKGMPPRPFVRFIRRHSSAMWPGYVLGAYARAGWFILSRHTPRRLNATAQRRYLDRSPAGGGE